jgi:sec-independent protein translocase protein TatA
MDLGAPELLIILLVVVLLFGAKKLPELARGSGRALRIFKQEVTAGPEPGTAAPDAGPAGSAHEGDDRS